MAEQIDKRVEPTMRARLIRAALTGMWGADLAAVYARNDDVRYGQAAKAVDAVLDAAAEPTEAMIEAPAKYDRLICVNIYRAMIEAAK